jgi:monooxygenase
LKVDLVADFVCRLLKHIDNTGAKLVVPRADNDVFAKPPRRMPFISGYIRRTAGR